MEKTNYLSPAEQLQNLLKTSKPGIITSLFLGLVLVFAEQNISNPKMILIWFVTLFLLSIIRITLITVYQRDTHATVEITSAHLRNIRIGTFLSGIVWGLIGVLLFTTNDINHIIFLIFILAGLTAGNTVSNASDLPSSIGFSILTLSPITVYLLLDETSIVSYMGIALILYFGFTVVIGRFINASMIQSTILQHKAEASEKEAWISEERYRLILQHSPAGIVHYNQELIITYCNDRFAQLVKAPKEKLIGLDMNTLKDQGILPSLREALEGKEGSFEGEYNSTLSNTQLWLIHVLCAATRH